MILKMLFLISLFLSGTLAEYFICDSLGHACLTGSTCCKRSNGEFGCCPISSGVCCADSEGHCCPLGFPVCDIVHKQCKNHLQQSHELLTKSDSLNLQDAGDFFYGLASGMGIRLDQYLACTQQISISITLLIQVQKYLEGSTTLDNLIVLEKLGDALQHFSIAGFSCNGAFATSANFIQDFIEEVTSESDVLWQVLSNIMTTGNYMYRELSQIGDVDWKEKGYRIGKTISYLFRVS